MFFSSAWASRMNIVRCLGFIICLISLCSSANITSAQDSGSAADRAASDVDQLTKNSKSTTPPKTEGETKDRPALNLIDLAKDGGWLMLPILAMSIVMIVVAIERGMSLRRERILPQELVQRFGQLASTQGGFDPKRAYMACQEFPSVASNVIRSMLLKLGRPHSEVEQAVNEASQREATRLYSNVRILNLTAAITPLMGLLGTVWGMIEAFFATTNLEAGANKADQLAGGIYVALVTTFFGLAVAIPAAILAHFFEGRIQTLFHNIEELLFNLLPQVERYEGKMRIDESQFNQSIPQSSTAATSKSQITEPPIVAQSVTAPPAVPK